MHMQIGVLVHANTKEKAKDLAITVFESIVADYSAFDYYDIETSHQIHRLDSEDGKKLVKELHQLTKDLFDENMNSVRSFIWKTNEQIRENGMDRHYLYKTGEYVGHNIHLYDEYGEGIQSDSHLKDCTNENYIVTTDIN